MVSNQWLPGLGGGLGNLGETPDLTAVAGDQFVNMPLLTGIGDDDERRSDSDAANDIDGVKLGLNVRRAAGSRIGYMVEEK